MAHFFLLVPSTNTLMKTTGQYDNEQEFILQNIKQGENLGIKF
jgi:hypothetical protein